MMFSQLVQVLLLLCAVSLLALRFLPRAVHASLPSLAVTARQLLAVLFHSVGMVVAPLEAGRHHALLDEAVGTGVWGVGHWRNSCK